SLPSWVFFASPWSTSEYTRVLVTVTRREPCQSAMTKMAYGSFSKSHSSCSSRHFMLVYLIQYCSLIVVSCEGHRCFPGRPSPVSQPACPSRFHRAAARKGRSGRRDFFDSSARTKSFVFPDDGRPPSALEIAREIDLRPWHRGCYRRGLTSAGQRAS